MVTVFTKDGLKNAIESREAQIKVIGDLADTMRKKTKVRKASKLGAAALVIGGIVAIPFTGGASAVMTIAGLTVGTVTISVVELAILCGFVLGMTGILKGARVQFCPDGSVIIEPKYK